MVPGVWLCFTSHPIDWCNSVRALFEEGVVRAGAHSVILLSANPIGGSSHLYKARSVIMVSHVETNKYSR